MRVSVGGEEIAESREALILQEATDELHEPVFYIPRKDVNLDHLEREEHISTQCPIKGTASYFTFKKGDDRIENIAWSYEDPKTTQK